MPWQTEQQPFLTDVKTVRMRKKALYYALMRKKGPLCRQIYG